MNESSVYQEKVRHLIQEFKRQIERLQSNAESMEGTHKDQMMLKIEKLGSLQNELQSQYRLLTTTEDRVVEELKSGIDGTVEELVITLNRALYDFINGHRSQ